MKPFHCAPGSVSDALAVDIGLYEQQFKIAALAVDLDDHPADFFIAGPDPVGFPFVDGLRDRFTGDDLLVFLKVIVSPPELLQRAIVEGFLVVQDELFPIRCFQRKELYFSHTFPPDSQFT